jgi:hypothetical protein
MRICAYLPSLVASFAAAAFASLTSAAAGDAAFCVTCSGPDQTYLCHVTGEDVRQDDALKLYCIVRTAKEGGHASCGARNEVANCPGVTKVYAYDGPSLPAGTGQAETVEAGIDEAFDQQAEEETGPSTLVEATGRAYSASRRGMRNVRARFGRGEAEEQAALPSSVPSDSLPASAAAPGSLPELPGGGAEPSPLTPLPSAMVPEPATETALVPPQSESAYEPAPAESKGRVRRGAQNVGRFAKKSYRCVRTLFRGCREQPEALAPN